jgi:hypothetical protein
MKIFAILAAFALTAAEPAAPSGQPSPTLSIVPGETVTVRIAEDPAGFVIVDRSSGEPQGERSADTLRFSFSDLGGMTMLQVENGYARAFDYRARMFLGRRSAPTSICTVMPGIMGFESWPHAIDRLELREPRLSEDADMGCR